ncbi:hypothetical protein [Salinispora oceanensis]|uniref:hypothetical protein n=1 Tax=Salinispora oceanensis TaxID=1050199 RepID=UPI00036F83FE|nr:hypothetical protein [Salinispora oceanensis]
MREWVAERRGEADRIVLVGRRVGSVRRVGAVAAVGVSRLPLAQGLPDPLCFGSRPRRRASKVAPRSWYARGRSSLG